jgi:hypothetical protein
VGGVLGGRAPPPALPTLAHHVIACLFTLPPAGLPLAWRPQVPPRLLPLRARRPRPLLLPAQRRRQSQRLGWTLLLLLLRGWLLQRPRKRRQECWQS